MKRLIYILPFLLVSCSPKIVYVPTETIRTVTEVVHDTTLMVKLDVIRDSVAVRDTFSVLTNKYAYSTAKWQNGLLNHSLGIKNVSIPIRVQYVNKTIHDTTTRTIVQPLGKTEQFKIANYDKLKASNKSKSETILKLIGIVALLALWTFRKPILKLIKPI